MLEQENDSGVFATSNAPVQTVKVPVLTSARADGETNRPSDSTQPKGSTRFQPAKPKAAATEATPAKPNKRLEFLKQFPESGIVSGKIVNKEVPVQKGTPLDEPIMFVPGRQKTTSCYVHITKKIGDKDVTERIHLQLPYEVRTEEELAQMEAVFAAVTDPITGVNSLTHNGHVALVIGQREIGEWNGVNSQLKKKIFKTLMGNGGHPGLSTTAQRANF